MNMPWWIIVLCLLISLAGIMDHDLWTPDEPREAAISLKMSRTGNMIIPDLAGRPFVEKPPLYYIAASRMISFLGPISGNTAAIRLTSAFFGLGTLLMTWLLARRLMNSKCAILSLLVMATMPGFIHVTHWMLVDNALVFFVVAALWSFAEAYDGKRTAFLLLAGLFTAGAFLSKGLIGPAVIALGWLGLFIPWLIRIGRKRAFTARSIVLHLIAFLVFACFSLWWVIALRIVGGPDLWTEWFWTNQLGRLTGSASHLGHINGPFYYLEIAPVYMLPWVVILVAGLVGVITRIWRRQQLQYPWQFLLWWGIGGLIMLSISSTKRDIYLIVLLPAFAMMIALMLEHGVQRWAKGIFMIWSVVMLAALVSVALSPVLLPIFSALNPAFEKIVGNLIPSWTIINSVAIVVVVLCVILMMRKEIPFLFRWLAVTALTYAMLLALVCPIVDRVKSYGPAFRELAQGIKNQPADNVALWNPDETTRAGFYYYCNLVFPDISDIIELKSILDGTHSKFNGVIVLSKNFPPHETALPPWSVVLKVCMGPRRVLQWITACSGKKR